VTYDPFLRETFTAVKNEGSYLNGQSISTSSDHDFSRAYLGLSSRSARGEGYDYSPARSMEDFRDKGSKILSFVSFVYTGNRVASGQLLASVVGETNAWDIAACALLVEEAGGIVTDLSGKKRRFDEAGNGCIMAANQTVLEEFLKQVRTDS
jgi:myo-inositol-1(or 4)-monophosphatase